MSEWSLESSTDYERAFKFYEKKHPSELRAVLSNLAAYTMALKKGVHPQFIRAGYIHDEPQGIKALDQKGGGKKQKLQQTRLYIYPELDKKTLHLITIGDKVSQRSDIKLSIKYVDDLIGGGDNGQTI